MITAVLDTNVLVSSFPGRQGAPAELIVSEHILDGAIRAWNKPWFRPRFPQQDMEQALSLLRSEAAVVVPASGIHGIAPDDEDDLILATAVAGNADYLVTGDRRFRALGQYEAIAIRTPREFVDFLDQERLVVS